MNKTFSIPTLVCFVLAATAPLLAGDTLESVEKKLLATWDKYDTLSASMTITADMAQMGQKMSMKGTGEYRMMKKGKQNLSRVEMTSTMNMGGDSPTMTVQTKSVTVFDGEFMWALNEQMGMKTAVKMKPEKQEQMGGRMMFDWLRKTYDMKLLPDQKLEGKPVYVVEGTPKQPSPQMPVKSVLVYFDQKLGVLVKIVGHDGGGKPVHTMTFSDIKLNPKLKPEQFVFKVPEGVPLLDQTGG